MPDHGLQRFCQRIGENPLAVVTKDVRVLVTEDRQKEAAEKSQVPFSHYGNSGLVFMIPDRSTPANGLVPTAHEVAPWVAVIERLWDGAEFEVEHRRRALVEAKRWDGDKLAEQ